MWRSFEPSRLASTGAPVVKALASFALVVVLGPLGCTSASDERLEVTVTLDEEVPTRATLSWSTPSESQAELAFGEELERSLVEDTPTREHRFTLLGLPADTEIAWEIASEGVSGSFTTGSLPPQVPTFTMEGDAPLGDRWYALVVGGAEWGVLLLDAEARVTWWHLHGNHNTTRAWVSRDQSAMLYNYATSFQHLENGEEGAIVSVPFDGGPELRTPLPFNHHDFLELPDGRYAVLTFDEREIDGRTVLGDQVVEVEPGTGESTVVWNVFDHYSIDEVPGAEDAAGWSHANALDYDEATDTYLLSLHDFGSIVKFDRQGNQLWSFGGLHNDFTFLDDSPQPTVQHQFELRDGRLLVFDNGGSQRPTAEVRSYAVDEGAMTAVLDMRYTTDPPEVVPMLGDTMQGPDGSVIIDWSVLGTIQRVAPEGSVLLQLWAELGYGFGYMSPVVLDTPAPREP